MKRETLFSLLLLLVVLVLGALFIGLFQRRVSGACDSGNAIRVIHADGTVTCEPVGDGIADVRAGDGLIRTVSDGVVTLAVQFGGSGSATTAARSDHDHEGIYAPEGHTHDDRYYTEAELNTSGGGGQVHWDNLTGVPAGFADGVDDTDGTRPGYQNVIVVAKSGGDFTSIQAALKSISDNSASNRYLIWVAPGTYTEKVTMRQQYVDIEGAGELVTKITAAGSSVETTGTVVVANNDAELRFLTVENTGGAEYAIAIYNEFGSPRLTHVTATASGGSYNYGVYNCCCAPKMTNVTVTASGGRKTNCGVFTKESSATIRNSVIRASGRGENYGIWNVNGTVTTVTVDNSQITGSTNTIRNCSACIVYVGASKLDGGDVTGGDVKCAGVYDENYTFYNDSCP